MWQLHPGSRRFQSAGTALVTEDSAATVRQQTAVQENTRPVCLQAFLTSGPWVALKCWQAGGMPQVSEHLALVDSGAYTWSTSERSWMWLRAQDDDGGVWATALGVAIFCIGVGFCVFSLRDVHRFVMLLASSAVERQQREDRRALTNSGADTAGDDNLFALGDKKADSDELPDEQKEWSAGGIVLLTGYRFYTGFLTATWLPYLLAMEGEHLFLSKQAIFMGLAKLIYGATIVLNPVLGKVGDQATALSHGVGRRLFCRVGITLAGIGMYVCFLADKTASFMCSLSGIMLWRFGEAINDVTTEALVPEMVQPEQYQLASGIKASSFLLGGLLGYVLLLIFDEVAYEWLYFAYPLFMFFCSVPGLALLDSDEPFAPVRRRELMRMRKRSGGEPDSESFQQSLIMAYVNPIKYEGGFPRACLAVFIFGLGTTPMFFLLLIVRDLVGITEAVEQQQYFSLGSICFFIASAVTAVAVSMIIGKTDRSRLRPGGSTPQPQQQQQQQQQQHGQDPSQPTTMERQVSEGTARKWANAEMLSKKGSILMVATLGFGTIEFLLPCIALFEEATSRDRAYYLGTVFFGGFFGVAFSLFQDLTWDMLPADVDFANAMGFSTMSRLLGIGLGNFVGGLMLDMFLDTSTPGLVLYGVKGYILMCFWSGGSVFLSSALARSALRMAQEVGTKAEPIPSAEPAAAA